MPRERVPREIGQEITRHTGQYQIKEHKTKICGYTAKKTTQLKNESNAQRHVEREKRNEKFYEAYVKKVDNSTGHEDSRPRS